MFRELRRIDKKMEEEKVEEILTQSDYGVLSVLGDDDYPYGIPLNFYYEDNNLYFHAANSGHKIDAINKYPKVSFTIVDTYKILPEDLNTHFASVSIFGKASVMTGNDRVKWLRKLGMKYSSAFESNVDSGIKNELNETTMVKIEIEHKMGKWAR